MKHWPELIIEEEFNIPGRGLLLTTSLQRSGLVNEEWVADILISKGDTLLYKGNIYEVGNIESFQNLLDGKTSSQLGLIVKKIEYNHDRPQEDFKEQLDIIREKGFNPIAVSQIYLEDTFIFETDDEALEAFAKCETESRKVVGWWYGREKFAEAVAKYEKEMDNGKVLIHWLSELAV